MKSCKELEKELYLVIITDMLLHQVHFPGIRLEKKYPLLSQGPGSGDFLTVSIR